jgi:hypothetical protein
MPKEHFTTSVYHYPEAKLPKSQLAYGRQRPIMGYSTRTKGGEKAMEIDREHIVTQEETGENAPIEDAGKRAKAEMEELEDQAKKDVQEGLDEDAGDKG